MNPSPTRRPQSFSPLAVLAIALVLAAPSSGQEPPVEPEEEPVVRIRGTDIRDIESMRTGAIVLVGIDEGKPDYRGGAPALERARREATLVSEDWLYERKLAIYEQGGIHHHAVPVENRLPGARPIPRQPGEAGRDRQVSMWLLTGVTMLVACLAFIVWRSQQMQRVADEVGS